jgi:hypothetical protein
MTVAVAAILQESSAFLPVKARLGGFCPVILAGATDQTEFRFLRRGVAR